MCDSLCTNVHTIRDRTVLTIFPLIFRTVIVAQMLSTGWEELPIDQLLQKSTTITFSIILLRAKDVLPNTNRTQAAKITPGSDGMVPSAAAWCCLQRACSIPSLPGGDGSAQHVFCPWWPWPLTLAFKLVRASDQTCLPCEFGANPFSGSRDIWLTNKWKKQKAADSRDGTGSGFLTCDPTRPDLVVERCKTNPRQRLDSSFS